MWLRKRRRNRSPNRRESREEIGAEVGTTEVEEERTANRYKSAKRSQKSPPNPNLLHQPRIQSQKKLRRLLHQRRYQRLQKNLQAVLGQIKMMKQRKRMMSGSQLELRVHSTRRRPRNKRRETRRTSVVEDVAVAEEVEDVDVMTVADKRYNHLL